MTDARLEEGEREASGQDGEVAARP